MSTSYSFDAAAAAAAAAADDDDNDDDELFLRYGGPTKGVYLFFQPGPLSKILTIANLRHAASRV